MDEVFARYSGKRDAERMRAGMQEAIGEDGGEVENSHIKKVFAKLKYLLDVFWEMARDIFSGSTKGLSKLKPSDFADMAFLED